ncbi:ester cyclase [Actinokineospora sp. HUAS TT18]|uniref:ester cyclase n=1 Tax=Actinokineospora sp. HUAS TT18 TaxID=3447451 RepID=UPI003F51F262
MTTHLSLSHERLVARLFDTFNSRDVEAFAACYAEDAVMRDMAIGKTFTGRAEIAEFLRVWLAASPDSHIAVGEPIVSGDRAAVTWNGTGTLTGDFAHIPGAVYGSKVDQHAVTVLRFGPDGLIAEHFDYYDMFGLLQQMGIVPAP